MTAAWGPLAAAAVNNNKTGAGALPVVIGLVVIVVSVLRKTRGRLLQPRRLLMLPLIVLVVGVLAALPAAHDVRLHDVDDLVVGLDLLLSIGLGIVRGLSVPLYQQDGAIWYRYGTATVLLWGVSIVLRFLVSISGAQHGATELTTSSSLLFMLGLSLLTQNLVISVRTCRPANPSDGPARAGKAADQR